MSRIGDIRTALASKLSTISGLQVSPYFLANPTPPAMHVFPAEISYDGAMQRGLDLLTFTVQAFAAISTDVDSQKFLDQLLDPKGARSVKTALEADGTLGGLSDDLHVTENSGYRLLVRTDNTPVLMSEWTLIVYLKP